MVSLAGCSSDPVATPHGTIAYVEQGTQNLRVFDLATNHSTLIDGGQFAAVSIAPDAQHVAYSGQDEVVKFADRHGAVTQLDSGGEGGEAGRWITNTVMEYSITDAIGRDGTMILASLVGPPRFVPEYGAMISADGTIDTYVNPRGDVILENIDGTSSHVLVPTIDANAVNPRSYAGPFTPGQDRLLVSDRLDTGWVTHIVSLTGAATIDLPDLVPGGGGSPFGPQTFFGASNFSPDGSEMLMISDYTELVAVNLATGATRTITTFDARVSSGGAVFLDSTHVLWVRIEDHSVEDLGMYTISLHLAGPDGDSVIDDPGGGADWPAIAVLADGTIALPSDALFVRPDGTPVVENTAGVTNILGVTSDGTGIVGTSSGSVVVVEEDGAVHPLVTSGGSIGPSAAFTATD